MRGDERYQDEQQRDESRSMTTQSGGQGDWKGYVQPYRYYGPGYRGVGYYAVFYQGQDASDSDQDQPGQQEMQFDQRDVQYGQGQGTGAGWRSGRSGRSSRGQGQGASGQGSWGGRGGQTGQFAGRGPKGYQRSDERIREDVSDRLTEHGDLDASGIEVEVSQGVVTLTGFVDDRWGKRLAEDVVEQVAGVHDVMNQLRVHGQQEQGAKGQGDDMATRSSSGTSPQMTGTETTASGSKSQGRNGRRATTTTTR
ncbi:MAG: BON domain-containing protein [Chloroflexota bacterium]